MTEMKKETLPPLAERMRPRSLDEVYGQEHLTGKGKILDRIIENNLTISLIFWGPPGSGKTSIARILAEKLDFPTAYFSAVLSGIKEVKQVMESAEAKKRMFGKPTIIFIDEIDALLGRFSSEVGGEARVRNQFLKEMDGLQDKDSKYHVYVIGATNKPWLLDDGFVRRFNKRIYIPLPNEEARLEMLKIYTKNLKLDPSVDLVELAKRTEGYSGSDIKDLIVEAHNRVVREYFEV